MLSRWRTINGSGENVFEFPASIPTKINRSGRQFNNDINIALRASFLGRRFPDPSFSMP